MFDGMTLEELNALYNKEHGSISMDYDEFFDEMYLTDAQKQKRKEMAEKIQEIMEWLLALVFYYTTAGAYGYMNAITEAEQSYKDLVRDAGVSESFVNNHIPIAVTSVVNTMTNNPDNMFNYTTDRARMIAENEANSIWNDAEFEEAVKAGMTRKTWHTILDKKTRDWHAEVNGQTRPILEPFDVDGELLLFPRDESLGASGGNVVNCRCSVTYS